MLMNNLLSATESTQPCQSNYVGNAIKVSENSVYGNGGLTINRKLDNILDIMASTKPVEAPKSVEETTLNDDEINEILSYLLEIQEKYFSDIPLSKDLCKSFMWNIPHNIYDVFRYTREYDMPDIANPILLFYIFCAANQGEVYDQFIGKLMQIMSVDNPDNKAYYDECVNVNDDIEEE